MFCNTFIITLSLALGFILSGFAQTRIPTIQHLPTADILWDRHMSVSTQYVFYGLDSNTTKLIGPYYQAPLVDLSLGFGDRVELGVQYGIGDSGSVSFDFHARLIQEGKFIPALTVGVTDVLGSQEAFVHRMLTSAQIDQLLNKPYIVASKNLQYFQMRWHLGVQFRPEDEEKVTGFGALEYYFGYATYLTLELYQRALGSKSFKEVIHSYLGVVWKFWGDRIILGVGLSELPSYFGQGISISKESGSTNGYNTQGIWATFSLNHDLYVPFGRKKGISQEVEKMKEKNYELSEKFNTMIDYQRSQDAQLKENAIVMAQLKLTLETDRLVQKYKDEFLKIIREIKEYSSSPETYKPAQISEASRRILSYGNDAIPVLIEILFKKDDDPELQSIIIELLGRSKNALGVPALTEFLKSKSDNLRIDAAIALAKIKDPRSIHDLESMLADEKEVIRITAVEALREITGKEYVEGSGKLDFPGIKRDQSGEKFKDINALKIGVDPAMQSPAEKNSVVAKTDTASIPTSSTTPAVATQPDTLASPLPALKK